MQRSHILGLNWLIMMKSHALYVKWCTLISTCSVTCLCKIFLERLFAAALITICSYFLANRPKFCFSFRSHKAILTECVFVVCRFVKPFSALISESVSGSVTSIMIFFFVWKAKSLNKKTQKKQTKIVILPTGLPNWSLFLDGNQ